VTTGWRETVPCQRCGNQVSTEQPIKSWIRAHRDLDSRRACLCIGDSDLWVQRYGTRPRRSGVDRDTMHLMLVEIKTNARDLDASQRDLLYAVDQLLRTNGWKEERAGGRFRQGHPQNARLVYSYIAGRQVQIICHGVHKLRLSGSTPNDSDSIIWDKRPITVEQMVALLRYDLNPDSLRPIEHYRSHKGWPQPPEQLSGLADLLQPGG
jgi:hypothetical protein